VTSAARRPSVEERAILGIDGDLLDWNPDVRQLPVTAITFDPDIYCRAEMHHDVIERCARALADGARFPPIVVFFDGNLYRIADWVMRLRAHQQIGLAEITAEVRQGTRRDALLFSLGANAVHGAQETPCDRERNARRRAELDGEI
jgi:ParB-like chromosome segregation protein Spo0J